MCITRVGKVLQRNGKIAMVCFVDDALTKEVDVSMLQDIKINSFVEVYADLALNTLTPKEARLRRKLWMEMKDRTGREIL